MKTISKFLTLLLVFSLFACNSKSEQVAINQDKSVETEEQQEITQENLKQSKQDLLQKMANDLYLEAEKEIEAAPAVQMDQKNIYKDIKPVDVEVETAPSFDLGIEPQAEPEKIVQD